MSRRVMGLLSTFNQFGNRLLVIIFNALRRPLKLFRGLFAMAGDGVGEGGAAVEASVKFDSHAKTQRRQALALQADGVGVHPWITLWVFGA